MKSVLPTLLITASVLSLLTGCGAGPRVAPIAHHVATSTPAKANTTKKPVVRQANKPAPALPFLTSVGAGAATFAPAGDQIAFSAGAEGRKTLYLSRPDGSNARPLGQGAFEDAAPAWSPSGDALVFVRKKATGSSLLRFSFARKGVETLLDSLETLQDPAWVPGGRAIVFVSTQNNASTLFRLEPGSAPVVLWRGGAAAHPTVSADGHVVFETVTAEGSQLMRVGLNGGSATPLAVEGDAPRQPSFSPSGMSLAYVAEDGLYVARADGSGASRVAQASGIAAPRWNPRAPQILLVGDRGASTDLQVVPLPTR